MLNGMDFRSVHNRFIIGPGHADIKGGDNRISSRIFSGNIDAREKGQMVDGKACYFFHGKEPSFLLLLL